MKKIEQQFQSRDYRFPKIAYIGFVSVKVNDKRVYKVCLSRLFDNFEILKRYVLFVISEFSKSNDDFTLTYDGYFIKATFDRLFPLKKSHWNARSVEIPDFHQRSKNDINIIKYWKMSEILVTPDEKIDHVEFYSLALSLFKNTSYRDIDLLIKNSDQAVDIKAKNAAIYSLGKPAKVDWLAGSKNIHDIKILEEYIN